MKWWRKLPGWHIKEGQLRDWYMGLVGRVDLEMAPEAYDRAVQWLGGVNDVTGYREVRHIPSRTGIIASVEAEMATPAGIPTTERQLQTA